MDKLYNISIVTT